MSSNNQPTNCLHLTCHHIISASILPIFPRNLDQQLYNQANEIQQDISTRRWMSNVCKINRDYLYRYDLRSSQIQLAGIRAQVQIMEECKIMKNYILERAILFQSKRRRQTTWICRRSSSWRTLVSWWWSIYRKLTITTVRKLSLVELRARWKASGWMLLRT